ncbi:hypothetical protein Y1Q_0024485 [Alligator mississippiensis]|uniref:Uncharacterized protein n=1 Tax=Alligator mississippiensis TaxID=8496 RepID=A0A151NBJ2_ALLMI|nr:hypothetical protein Y1Q_0024485 [Alligator mississippiensis]
MIAKPEGHGGPPVHSLADPEVDQKFTAEHAGEPLLCSCGMFHEPQHHSDHELHCYLKERITMDAIPWAMPHKDSKREVCNCGAL